MVSILLADGFEESEALITADLLRRAGIEVALTGLSGDVVVSSHQIKVIPDNKISDLHVDDLNMVILPGGLGGVDGIKRDTRAMELLHQCHDRGCFLAAICAAPTILAQLGFLKGLDAVCYPGMEDQMGDAMCKGKAFVVVSGRMITGEACGSTFLFALKLIELLKGKEMAEQVRHEIYYHG